MWWKKCITLHLCCDKVYISSYVSIHIDTLPNIDDNVIIVLPAHFVAYTCYLNQKLKAISKNLSLKISHCRLCKPNHEHFIHLLKSGIKKHIVDSSDLAVEFDLLQTTEEKLFKNWEEKLRKKLPSNHSLLFNPNLSFRLDMHFLDINNIFPEFDNHKGGIVTILAESFFLPENVWTFYDKHFCHTCEISIKMHQFCAVCFVFVDGQFFFTFRSYKGEWYTFPSFLTNLNCEHPVALLLNRRNRKVPQLQKLCSKRILQCSKSIVDLEIPKCLKSELRQSVTALRRFCKHPFPSEFSQWRQ